MPSERRKMLKRLKEFSDSSENDDKFEDDELKLKKETTWNFKKK